jgi:peptidoglycan/xylan/chitin deacetylase (PgdA/CDA1 family)
VIDWIGKEGYLTWDEVKELDRQGFKIGSHTLTHPQDLKMIHDEQLHVEVQNSKDLIETVLGHNIDSFCYPRGRADERVRRKVMESGYKDARGTGKTGITKIEDKFYLPGTIHIFQREEYLGKPILNFAKEVINKVKKEGGYCNIWGHSQEIDRDNNWEVLEEILKYASL